MSTKVELTLACGDYEIMRALKDGTVRPDGIDLKVVTAMDSPTRHWRFLRGHEFEIAEVSSSSYIAARDNGHPFRAIPVFPHRRFRHGFAFINTAKGIKTPQDLIGKKVGVPSLNTLIHVIARRWLELNGVDYNKVNFAEIGFQQMFDALNGGIVDGVSAIDPYYGKLETIGYVVGNPDESLPPNTLTSVYAAGGDWAKSHKDTVAAFRASLADAIDYINANNADARAAIVKYTKQPEAVVAATPMPELQVTVHPQQVQFFIDLARHQGLIKSNPDAAAMIAP
jgi:ABC-type nitrate/sulfonate/bicarbonate transport system substrate-binding protein